MKTQGRIYANKFTHSWAQHPANYSAKQCDVINFLFHWWPFHRLKCSFQTLSTQNNKLVWITTAESLMYAIKVLKVKISLTLTFSLHLYCRSSCSLAGDNSSSLSLSVCAWGVKDDSTAHFFRYTTKVYLSKHSWEPFISEVSNPTLLHTDTHRHKWAFHLRSSVSNSAFYRSA